MQSLFFRFVCSFLSTYSSYPTASALEVHRKYTPHVYRHYLTTILRDNNCSERVIRYIRGDADASIVDRYDHLKWETISEEYCAAIDIIFSN